MVKGGLLLLSPLPAGIKHWFWEISLPLLVGQSCGTAGPPIVSNDVMTCPSLDMGILTGGDHVGMCCS